MSHKEVIEIEGPSKNLVEQLVNDIRKKADDGGRYDIDFSIRRVDVSAREVEGFND